MPSTFAPENRTLIPRLGRGRQQDLRHHGTRKVDHQMDMFNVTNSVRFDPKPITSTLDNPQSFGQVTALLTSYRLAQFAGRIEF
jgi:hypothetical protein